jgi:hypothetical protein
MAIQLSGFKCALQQLQRTERIIAIELNGVKFENYRRMRFLTASRAYQAQLFLNGWSDCYQTYPAGIRGTERFLEDFVLLL